MDQLSASRALSQVILPISLFFVLTQIPWLFYHEEDFIDICRMKALEDYDEDYEQEYVSISQSVRLCLSVSLCRSVGLSLSFALCLSVFLCFSICLTGRRQRVEVARRFPSLIFSCKGEVQ